VDLPQRAPDIGTVGARARPMPEVIERYQQYRPLLAHKRIVERALASIPPDRVEGLDRVTLRDFASLTAGERRGGRVRCQGSYLREKGRRPPRIELFVDQIFDQWPRWIAWLPILRSEILLNVLFHEVAHHVQAERLQRKSLAEAEAERIGFELARMSFEKRHPWLVPWARLLRRLIDWRRAAG
jgi:predicted Zn-dependent protease with MMP-like domain